MKRYNNKDDKWEYENKVFYKSKRLEKMARK